MRSQISSAKAVSTVMLRDAACDEAELVAYAVRGLIVELGKEAKDRGRVIDWTTLSVRTDTIPASPTAGPDAKPFLLFTGRVEADA